MIAEVIAAYGRHLLLRDAQQQVHKARPFGRALEIVCGDRVQCEPHGTELLVCAALPRACLLRRSSARGRSEPVAANFTQLAAVAAPVPAPDMFLLDRYLCAAASLGLQALIVMNKNDIPESRALREQLAAHAALGYDLLSVNADSAAGAAPLRERLRGHTTILVGQSGVGKSSLTRLLTGEEGDIAIGALLRDQEGRHTTTASRLYDCDGDRIIDAPGVRDFAPAIDDLDATTLGFREIARLAGQCRFLDCRHMQEPGCAVREAVATGAIDARRYESYRRLRRLYEQLWRQRPERERAGRR
ncbi:MAG TPA: ribosome small subunit-dependent GTPase A [Steroidobacteraceae bacterium]|nr:ribosome small subunit-dependent GTPase A [Steroidobacteraceae bacterium]